MFLDTFLSGILHVTFLAALAACFRVSQRVNTPLADRGRMGFGASFIQGTSDFSTTVNTVDQQDDQDRQKEFGHSF